MTKREIDPTIFKAYDIRGTYPDQIDEDVCYRIARAYVSATKRKRVVVGHDMRETADVLVEATIRGVTDQGADAVPIGLTSTPMYYYAVNLLEGDAGMMVTASHNPAGYNGYKMTGPEAVPSISYISNLELCRIASAGEFQDAARKGTVHPKEDVLDRYIEAVVFNAGVLSFGDLKIAVDTGNGMAGLILPELFDRVGNEPIKLFWEIDGRFPNHEANPLKLETLVPLQKTVVDRKADLGVAYDGDGDRVAFVDENGQTISGDFITALIAKEMLKRQPGAKIFYDIRSSWVVGEEIKKAGGVAVPCRVGHGLIKRQMRAEGGYFAGELSSHYYFSDFYYTDNGDLTFLNMVKLLLAEGKPLSELVAPLRRYFHTGEINSEVHDIPGKLSELKAVYEGGRFSELDGLTVEFKDWWFNVRPSNTEPLMRLNLEAKTKELMEEKKKEVLELIRK
ncbi:MAG: phosphomannomutase/phosphoglucomutase [Armatimonadetes bacterium]|nr:phosphomannomutase/phosphoglucomutase [Armatimonadota bacterium]